MILPAPVLLSEEKGMPLGEEGLALLPASLTLVFTAVTTCRDASGIQQG